LIGVSGGKDRLDAEFNPDGYNAGSAAGHSVPHIHIHVIARYRGDTEKSRRRGARRHTRQAEIPEKRLGERRRLLC
jgi:diadenosine tetraphosphate (Ap4A) HIT family hydrolase